jgi:hypothetical protein
MQEVRVRFELGVGVGDDGGDDVNFCFGFA